MADNYMELDSCYTGKYSRKNKVSFSLERKERQMEKKQSKLFIPIIMASIVFIETILLIKTGFEFLLFLIKC